MTEDIPEHLKMTVGRLYSQDANDRVKAAGELGEIGTPIVAPQLLAVAYDDEASTVRQMAIQSYGEILGIDANMELIKASRSHFDEYVQMYAMNTLGNIGGEDIGNAMLDMMHSSNPRLQATALRAMIHAQTEDLAGHVYELLQNTLDVLIQRNCIEALAFWKHKPAKEYIRSHFFALSESLELKTISAFYLAILGDKKGLNYLKEGEVDNYIRVAVNDQHFRGKKGLVEAVGRIK